MLTDASRKVSNRINPPTTRARRRARRMNGRSDSGKIALAARQSADLEPVAANVGCLAQAVGGALEDDLAVAHHIDTP